MSEAAKNILILGAGLMQRPAILAAKELGYRACVVDANAQAVCVPLADTFAPIDLKDRDALLAFAKALSESADGLATVFTCGTDFSASVAYIAEHFGFRSHSFDACLNASDKLRMRACFTQYGVPSPAFIEVQAGELKALASQCEQGRLALPKVVKPCDNMGGRGCRMVRSTQEFMPAVQTAVRHSRTARAILEDYMEGAEYSIDALVYNGTLTITGFADRHIYYPPYFIETGHTMPTAVDEKKRLELIATFALGIQSLGLSCGVAKADIKYTKNGPMIGEIAARLSGGYMSGWTYPYASDESLTKYALEIALGKTPTALEEKRVPLPWTPHASVQDAKAPFALYELPCKRWSAERAWISIPGIVHEVTGLEAASQVCDIRDVLPRVKAGDTVSFPRNNVEKGGNVIAVSATREQAEHAAYTALDAIVVRLKPHTAATDAFLCGKAAEDEQGFPPPAFPDALLAYEKQLAKDGTQAGALQAAVVGARTGALGAASAEVAQAAAVYADVAAPDNAVLQKDKPLVAQIPACLAEYCAASTDWNHRTLTQALTRFDSLCPPTVRPSLLATRFWLSFLRGSVQGALYVADCARDTVTQKNKDEASL